MIFILKSENFKDTENLAIDSINIIFYKKKNRALMRIQICGSLQHEIYENGYLTNIVDDTTVTCISNV